MRQIFFHLQKIWRQQLTAMIAKKRIVKLITNMSPAAGSIKREFRTGYLAASGKSYQNYAAALRIWAGNDKKGAPKKGIPDYSCKEGESL